MIYSGIGYDVWMEKLLGTGGKPGRVVIDVAGLIGARDGDNPHIWYDPRTMPALAEKLAAVLAQSDPAGRDQDEKRLADFTASMQPVIAEIARLKAKTQGVRVTATEPVFGYMARALGFEMLNGDFQIKIMNDSEPSAAETAAFEESLTSHTARMLFYNSQVTDPTTARMQEIAKESGRSGHRRDRDAAARPEKTTSIGCCTSSTRCKMRSRAEPASHGADLRGLKLPSAEKGARFRSPMSAALLISDLGVSLGGNPILSGVNAEIRAGEFIGVFGPNGAGKTTLMRCLLGTLRPSRGSITIFGLTPARASREIGYMPQGNMGFESSALSARALVHARLARGTLGRPVVVRLRARRSRSRPSGHPGRKATPTGLFPFSPAASGSGSCSPRRSSASRNSSCSMSRWPDSILRTRRCSLSASPR